MPFSSSTAATLAMTPGMHDDVLLVHLAPRIGLIGGDDAVFTR